MAREVTTFLSTSRLVEDVDLNDLNHTLNDYYVAGWVLISTEKVNRDSGTLFIFDREVVATEQQNYVHHGSNNNVGVADCGDKDMGKRRIITNGDYSKVTCPYCLRGLRGPNWVDVKTDKEFILHYDPSDRNNSTFGPLTSCGIQIDCLDGLEYTRSQVKGAVNCEACKSAAQTIIHYANSKKRSMAIIFRKELFSACNILINPPVDKERPICNTSDWKAVTCVECLQSGLRTVPEVTHYITDESHVIKPPFSTMITACGITSHNMNLLSSLNIYEIDCLDCIRALVPKSADAHKKTPEDYNDYCHYVSKESRAAGLSITPCGTAINGTRRLNTNVWEQVDCPSCIAAKTAH